MKKIILSSFILFSLPLFIFSGFLQAQDRQDFIEIPGLLSQKEVTDITCGGGEQVRDHMQEMGDLISDMGSYVDALLNTETSLEDYRELKELIVRQSQLLRVHLAAVLVKNPPKLLKIDPSDPARAKILFQEFLLVVIQKTIAIEKKIREEPTEPKKIKEQNIEVGALLISIGETVERAHSRFR